jgi:predicted flap endonuclease-1-like 5' DNA nuclease
MTDTSGNAEYDDLTVIKGIGPARQQWFRETLGVKQYRDLAALSAEVILEQLKSEGRIATKDIVKTWLAQASALVESTDDASHQPQGTVSKAEDAADWQPTASFVVEFRERTTSSGMEFLTAVHHIESDKGASWPGIADAHLCQWMLAELTDEAQITAGMVVPSAKHAGRQVAGASQPVPSQPASRVKVHEIRIFQPPEAPTPLGRSKPGDMFPRFIRSNVPFVVETVLGSPKVGDDVLPVQRLNVLIHARELAGKRMVEVGQSGAKMLNGDADTDSVRTRGRALTAGLYRLTLLIRVADGAGILGRADIPVLEVV